MTVIHLAPSSVDSSLSHLSNTPAMGTQLQCSLPVRKRHHIDRLQYIYVHQQQ